MLRARIRIHLPCERIDPRRPRGRRKFDVPLEQAGVSPLAVVKALFGGLSAAGVRDAASLLVDQEPVFVDFHARDGDLEDAYFAALDRRLDERGFTELQLVSSTRRSGLHVVLDANVHLVVPLGDPSIVVDISARPHALAVVPGDRADVWRQRVEQYAAAGFLIEEQRLALDAWVRRIAAAIAERVECGDVVAEQSRIEVLVPEPNQVAAFGGLPFGPDVIPLASRPLPPASRMPDADPFDTYYADPYWPLTCWVLLDGITRRGNWCSPDVWLVDAEGYQVATGDDPAPLAWSPRVLRFGENVSVNEDEAVAAQWLADPDAVV